MVHGLPALSATAGSVVKEQRVKFNKGIYLQCYRQTVYACMALEIGPIVFGVVQIELICILFTLTLMPFRSWKSFLILSMFFTTISGVSEST